MAKTITISRSFYQYSQFDLLPVTHFFTPDFLTIITCSPLWISHDQSRESSLVKSHCLTIDTGIVVLNDILFLSAKNNLVFSLIFLNPRANLVDTLVVIIVIKGLINVDTLVDTYVYM